MDVPILRVVPHETFCSAAHVELVIAAFTFAGVAQLILMVTYVE